ncbi:class I adenylate-forming enzyme family protein [Lysinibacillus sp. LZ02]|uniref:class I adenylate-forming enzyme family protein n=1 Tax=Lysinibacillus sp. LZ02 TaxID=3420668 RepID=UPI003D36CDFF
MQQPITMLNRIALGDSIRRSAWRYPNKEVVIDGDRRFTFQDVFQHTNQFANYLLNQGLQKGDRVATICLNSYEHIVAMYGIEKAACIWAPVNPVLTSSDIDYILKAAEVKLVVVDDILYKAHEALLKQYDCLLVTANDAENSFTKAYQDESMEEPEVDIQDRDIAHIMFTSGTTSNPKGVMTSHLSIHLAGLGSIIELGLDRTISTVGMMPFFHCAQHTFINAIMILGGKITVMKKFDPVELMQIVEQEKVNFTFLLPIMYRAIIFHPERKNYNLSSLKQCLYAMTQMDRTTLETGIKELGAEFWLATGQTEMYPGTAFFRPEYQLTKRGSYWGEPSIVNDLAIMDDEGNILPNKQVGEIVHRGPNVMNGYLNNPEATKEASKFGWHHTGDLGYIDEDGLLVFVDRKKDLIKTGGENVASIHVEQKMLDCEHVENCVVVGLPHPRWIEAVTAFVKVKDGATAEDVYGYCREHLANFQVPKKIILVDEFPMTSTGKIQKHVLRSTYVQLYANEPELA